MLSNENIEDQVAQLRSPHNKEAYRALESLIDASEQSDIVYRHINIFIEMMRHPNSYIRTRGLTLIACNARWDKADKIDEVIDEYLEHMGDEKPITARQCVKAVPQIVKAKPELAERVADALRHADLSKYPDTMRSLVQKDICDTLVILAGLQKA